jgi:hypothetical protein
MSILKIGAQVHRFLWRDIYAILEDFNPIE